MVLCRGKLISRVDNHIIWLEPFLKYNLGPFSWLYERMRPVTGKLYGMAGQHSCSSPTRLIMHSVSQSAYQLSCGKNSRFAAGFPREDSQLLREAVSCIDFESWWSLLAFLHCCNRCDPCFLGLA